MTDEHRAETETPDAAEDEAAHLHEDGGRKGESRQERKKPLSEVLTTIAGDESRDYIAVGDLLKLLGGRGRAALILLFALPNVLPTPPGTSGILGLPLLYLSFQMMLGRVPWLPRFIGERSMSRYSFGQLVDRISALLSRAERLLKPRWSVFVGYGPERVLGAVCLVLAAVLVLPIPLGNMLPAFAICLIALGVLERDGVWVLSGVVIGGVSLVIVAGVVYALVKSAVFVLMNAFG
ncbi:MAG TPA: exopolysaccharide biosynthesis protein [Albidovulum sp.]|uniref:exopolysaccharide biosynthesis protein n=1 Tax=Albidovulum sp. TaxID=1872424 RepID=UPI002CD311C8|nr:exopolysaccharide biosynthesis protein [Albidovulum sp.]